jgi:hypothetical protein
VAASVLLLSRFDAMFRFGGRLRFSRPELMLCFASMAVFDVLSRVDDVLRFGIVFGSAFPR